MSMVKKERKKDNGRKMEDGSKMKQVRETVGCWYKDRGKKTRKLEGGREVGKAWRMTVKRMRGRKYFPLILGFIGWLSSRTMSMSGHEATSYSVNQSLEDSVVFISPLDQVWFPSIFQPLLLLNWCPQLVLYFLPSNLHHVVFITRRLLSQIKSAGTELVRPAPARYALWVTPLLFNFNMHFLSFSNTTATCCCLCVTGATAEWKSSSCWIPSSHREQMANILVSSSSRVVRGPRFTLCFSLFFYLPLCLLLFSDSQSNPCWYL